MHTNYILVKGLKSFNNMVLRVGCLGTQKTTKHEKLDGMNEKGTK